MGGIRVTVHRPDLARPLYAASEISEAVRRVRTIPGPTPTLPSVNPGVTQGLWKELHVRAINWKGGDDSEWQVAFERRVPCGQCKSHWSFFKCKYPPDYARYFAWTVDAHNSVNARLGKEILSQDQAFVIWSNAKSG